MILYDAICNAEEARDLLPSVAKQVSESPESVDRIVKDSLSEANKVISRRAIHLTKFLAERGCVEILQQLASPGISNRVKSDCEGIILQLFNSGRWEKKYRKQVYDIVVAVPQLAKTIALSTTEIRTEIPVEDFQFCDRLKMCNFHFYPFFNRAHAVRAREATLVELAEGRTMELGKLKFLLRTTQHAKRIGASNRLCMFTPLETAEGLRLGFYFALICKVRRVSSVPGASGFGFDLSLSNLILEDEYGTLAAMMSFDAFRRSVEDPIQREYTSELKDPRDLERYSGLVLVVGAWFFNDQHPYVAFLGFLGNDPALNRYSILAYLNSVRKMERSEFETRIGSQDLCLQNLVEVNGEIYYKEDH
jgi:hypothetical protein